MDDQPDIRLLLKARFSLASNFELVAEAANGREAVELARFLRPDAMLLDLEMPVMNGATALPLLREAHPKMRIVVYSAVGDRYSLDASPPDAALVKGVNLNVVVDTLLRLLSESRDDAANVLPV